jgi:hypothetical protein
MATAQSAGGARAGPPRLSLAEVIQAALPKFGRTRVLLPDEWKVIRALTGCRTPVLGAHIYVCRDCGRHHFQYHSCRNRHCPRCQGGHARDWLEKQQESLLGVPYFHLVFTLPHALNPLVRQNRPALYKLLFDAASQTLLEFGQRRLGGQIGITAVLHTWGQNLKDHYHLHCLVTGGAWNSAQSRWQSARATFLFPVRALSTVFRAKFCQALEQGRETLELHGQLQALTDGGRFSQLLRQLRRTSWVVFAKKPLAGPEQVLRYLSLYTHRVALSEGRLVSLDRAGQTVTFTYKDYADGSRRKEMTLGWPEFLRRFLLHLLPKGFVKIRHYGLLGTRGRNARLAELQSSIGPPRAAQPPTKYPSLAAWLVALRLTTIFHPCPFCHSTRLVLLQVIHPGRRSPQGAWDSS